jgi:hypothetical protein
VSGNTLLAVMQSMSTSKALRSLMALDLHTGNITGFKTLVRVHVEGY